MYERERENMVVAGALVLSLYWAAWPFTYYVAVRLPKGWPRLAAILPFLPAFLVLPRFIQSPILRITQAMSWYTLLKLILLCYDRSTDTIRLAPPGAGQNDVAWQMATFPRFCITFCSPVSVKSQCTRCDADAIARIALDLFCMVLPIAGFVHFYSAIPSPFLIPSVAVVAYFGVQATHRFFAIFFLSIIGVDLLPVFDKPWLSSSISEFWGQRWNLTVNSLLREVVYKRVLHVLWGRGFRTRADEKPLKPPLAARLPAVFLTFLVSGFIHEVSFFGLFGSARPTWQLTLFFVLHGFVTCLEIAMRRWRQLTYTATIPTFVKILVTMIFVFASSGFLFFAPLLNSNICVDIASEYMSLVRLLMPLTHVA